MKKNVLVTGGFGYIGSHTIIELFEAKNYNPIIIDNFSNSSEKIVKNVESLVGDRIIYYNIDCRESLDEIIIKHNIEIIIHFAAFKSVNDSVKEPLIYYDNNIGSLINLLKTCKKHNIKNFIFSSSCSLYGDVKILPVNENTKLADIKSPYANTKLMGEKILKDFCDSNKNFNTICLRYFNPIGAHKSGSIGELPLNKPNNVLPIICESIYGDTMTVFGDDYNTHDGSCVRDYVHVSDIAKAHVLACDYVISNNQIGFDVFNLGSESGVSVLDLINHFEKINKVKVNYLIGKKRGGDVEKIFSDSKKAKKYLGWEIKHNLDDMVSSAWLWYNNLNNIINNGK